MNASRTILHTLICHDDAGNEYKAFYVTVSKRGVPMGSYNIEPEPPQRQACFETRWHPETLIDFVLRCNLRPKGHVISGGVA